LILLDIELNYISKSNGTLDEQGEVWWQSSMLIQGHGGLKSHGCITLLALVHNTSRVLLKATHEGVF